MSSVKVEVFGACVLLGVAMVGALLHQQADEARRDTEQSKRLANAELALAQLRSQLNSRIETLPAIQPQILVHPSATPARLDSSGLASSDAPRAHALAKAISTEQMRDGLSAQFYSERVDTTWSTTARRDVQARLEASIPDGAKVLSVECKSSMCRAEIAEPDITAHRHFIQSAAMGGTFHWTGGTMVALEDDPSAQGRVTAVAFFAREGQSLPTLDDAAL